MRKRNHKNIKSLVLMLGLFTVCAAAFAGVNALLNHRFSQDSIFKGLGGSDITIEDLSDESGKCVILDYPEFDVNKYVKLGDYSALKVSGVIKPAEITEQDVNDNIASFVERYDKFIKKTEGLIKVDDIVVMTCGAELNGEIVSDFVINVPSRVRLGTESEPPGFAEHIAGHNVGEEIKFNIVMPENFQEYANQAISFTVKVSEIDEVPEITDENVSEITNGNFTDAAAFRDYMREQIKEFDESAYQKSLETAVLDELVKSCSFRTPPKSLLAWQMSKSTRFYQDYADARDMTFEEYISEAGIAPSVSDLIYNLNKSVIESVKPYAVLEAVARAEGITADETADSDAVNTKIQELSESFGIEDRDELLNYYKMSNVLKDIRDEKTLAWLCDHAKIE